MPLIFLQIKDAVFAIKRHSNVLISVKENSRKSFLKHSIQVMVIDE